MTRTWIRRLMLALSFAPLAVIGILHKMGRTGDFGVLGKWYVMVPLTVAGLLAWLLVEKAIEHYFSTTEPSAPSSPSDPSEPADPSVAV